MKKFFKAIFAVLVIAMTMTIISCSDSTEGDSDLLGNTNSSYYMHYFYAKYGVKSAMIRSPENSNVAILSTSDSGDLYSSTFVQLVKIKTGNTYTFKGSKNETVYEVEGVVEAVPNGTTNDSFTVQYASAAIKNLGFDEGKSIQHWTELNKGDFVY